MQPFKRRYYSSLRAVWRDLVWPFRHRTQLKVAMQGDIVSVAFRERLMLAVTAVNRCRYCSYYHAKEALSAGLSTQEIQQLDNGDLAVAPDDELPALLYAQHWAEQDARPDPAIRQKLVTTYGDAKAEAIETILRLIRTGNLGGNTLDYWLYRLSFGRCGD